MLQVTDGAVVERWLPGSCVLGRVCERKQGCEGVLIVSMARGLRLCSEQERAASVRFLSGIVAVYGG